MAELSCQQKKMRSDRGQKRKAAQKSTKGKNAAKKLDTGTKPQAQRRLFCLFSFFYQGPKFYNTLNTNIINASSPFSFKRALKAFICNNY